MAPNDALGMKRRQAMSNVKTRLTRESGGCLGRHMGTGTWPNRALRQKRLLPAPNSGPARGLPAHGLIVLKLRRRFALFRIVGGSLISVEGISNRWGSGR
jgi:hypothetical protein